MNYKDGKHCYIYIQHNQDTVQSVSLELLSEAKRLFTINNVSEDVIAVVLGTLSDKSIESLTKCGADKVIVVKDKALNQYDVIHHTDVLTELIEVYHPQSFLIGGTVQGRDLAPRISARVHTGLTADATILELNHNEDETHSLAITRPAFGGNLFATIITPNHVPQMATIRPSVFERNLNYKIHNNIEYFTHHSPLNSPIIIEEIINKESKTKSINEARLIVSAGRGVKDCLDMVKMFADTLDAEMAASRALIDEGLIDKPKQVGQTGTTVRPSLYIACGISGALQHTAGMDKSETIIAINPDENAPIFDVADLGIIGDAKEILPIVIKMIREKVIETT